MYRVYGVDMGNVLSGCGLMSFRVDVVRGVSEYV